MGIRLPLLGSNGASYRDRTGLLSLAAKDATNTPMRHLVGDLQIERSALPFRRVRGAGPLISEFVICSVVRQPSPAGDVVRCQPRGGQRHAWHLGNW